MTAIYYKEKTISYKTLNQLIKNTTIENPIFPVTNTLDCTIKILTCFVKKTPFFPYNPQLPIPPDITIPKDCDFILQTTGSSKKKHVLFKKKNLLDANILTHEDFFLKPNDVYLINLPFYHIAGIAALLRAFLRLSAIAIEPENKHLVSHLSLVPTQARKLLEKNPYPNLKALLLGGSIIDQPLANALVDNHIPLYISYGMTEMSSHVFVEKYQKERGVCFSSPLRKRNVRIKKNGVLDIYGAGMFHRYLDGKQITSFSSNDIFEKRQNIYFFIKRKDFIFISGGENICPREIEETLQQHPKIQKVSISIQDDLKWGKRPLVKVYFSSDKLSKKSIQSYLETKLEKFKIPKDHEIFLY